MKTAKLHNNNGTEKIKILTLTDNPVSPTGIGVQSKLLFDGLIATGRYQIISIGGAIRHADLRPIKVNDDFLIYPTNGYGTPEMVRAFLNEHRPSAVLCFTDPRFWLWLWQHSDEIREIAPLFYNHLWDNKPTPLYNHKYYLCNDYIACINKVAMNILKELNFPKEKYSYIPHGFNPKLYFPRETNERLKLREKFLGEQRGKFAFLWVSRNSKRKRAGDMIKAFADVKKKHPNSVLFMKSERISEQGPDLLEICRIVGLQFQKDVILAEQFWPEKEMSELYAAADTFVLASSNEGFGLGPLCSSFSGIPSIVTKTGGMQDHIKPEFGTLIEPGERSFLGAQPTPYIYEDIVLRKDLVAAMCNMIEIGEEKRTSMGKLAREYVVENFHIDNTVKAWDEVLQKTIANFDVGRATINYARI